MTNTENEMARRLKASRKYLAGWQRTPIEPSPVLVEDLATGLFSKAPIDDLEAAINGLLRSCPEKPSIAEVHEKIWEIKHERDCREQEIRDKNRRPQTREEAADVHLSATMRAEMVSLGLNPANFDGYRERIVKEGWDGEVIEWGLDAENSLPILEAADKAEAIHKAKMEAQG